jgi:molybdopterin-guanine dinucleotide biosynthesis protein A
MEMFAFGAVVLAGGAARRMGGASKPALVVGGTSLLSRVLTALAAAQPRLVVGPPDLHLPAGVSRTIERPPGGGPVAATAEALSFLAACLPDRIALCAGDLPFLTAPVVSALLDGCRDDVDGAVLIDASGRPQWLTGVWWSAALARRLAELGPPQGRGLRELVGELRIRQVEPPSGLPAWFDCDTAEDLRQAEEWARDHDVG